jgi:hypothetical protein
MDHAISTDERFGETLRIDVQSDRG